MTQAQRGRALVLAVILVVLGMSLAVMIITNLASPNMNITRQSVRLLISISLCLLLYFGYSWARWVLVVLLAAGGLLASATGFLAAQANPGSVSLMAMGFIYLACACVLALSPSVGRFLKFQRRRLAQTAEPGDPEVGKSD